MEERYEIRVHGLLGPVLATCFDVMRCEVVPRRTTIRARLSTDELGRLLWRLDELGVEVIHLDCPQP